MNRHDEQEVLTNPDFREFVEQIADRIQSLLDGDDDEMADRMVDVVAECFPGVDPIETDVQALVALEEEVWRLARREVRPLVARIFLLGDWRPSCPSCRERDAALEGPYPELCDRCCDAAVEGDAAERRVTPRGLGDI